MVQKSTEAQTGVVQNGLMTNREMSGIAFNSVKPPPLIFLHLQLPGDRLRKWPEVHGSSLLSALMCSYDVAQLVERRTSRPSMQVRFSDSPVPQRSFSQSQLSVGRFTYCVPIPQHVLTSMSALDLVVRVRVQWIMETLKHPACTVAWVTRRCSSLLSPCKQILNPPPPRP